MSQIKFEWDWNFDPLIHKEMRGPTDIKTRLVSTLEIEKATFTGEWTGCIDNVDPELSGRGIS